MAPRPSNRPTRIGKISPASTSSITGTKRNPEILDGVEMDLNSVSKQAVPPAMVTPSTTASKGSTTSDQSTSQRRASARRTLFPPASSEPAATTSVVTPVSIIKRKRSDEDDETTGVTSTTHPTARRRLIFGKYVDLIVCQPNVEKVYKIVRKLTGSIGGNGYVGPIYGELTMGSMQKMINLMMKHCDLNKESRFIDVGSGIGKPNLHVAQFPGVAFSCGVEVEHTRWALGMTCLKATLDASKEEREQKGLDEKSLIQGNTVFLHRDIMEAKTFDPFTHVYMFSIGFPPNLWLKLSKMWNGSKGSEYLICYHSPKNIIECYGFDVELIAQMTTSMHGSKEGHMGYIYKRTNHQPSRNQSHCDPVFRPSWELVKQGFESLHENVTSDFATMMDTGRRTRSTKR